MNKPTLTLLALGAVSLTAFAAMSASTTSIGLRFVTASDAYKAVEDRLGPVAATAVRSVEIQRNALSIDASHPQAARVRDFVAAFDRRPAGVAVSAVITRHVEATADAPAHDEVLSQPSFYGSADKPLKLTIPGEGASTNIELRITYTPAQP